MPNCMEEKLTYKEMWEALKKRIQFSIDTLTYDSNNREINFREVICAGAVGQLTVLQEFMKELEEKESIDRLVK